MHELLYDIPLVIQIARAYYEEGLNQEQIARREHMSRSTISRILHFAQQQGYVQTVVHNPLEDIPSLEKKLRETFQLKCVRIVATTSKDSRMVKAALGKEGAKFLVEVIKPNDVLGVAWGTTIAELVNSLSSVQVPGISVVSLCGCTYESVLDDSVFETPRLAKKRLGGSLRLLYTPVIVSTKDVKVALMTDSNTRITLDLIAQCNVLINGIGCFAKDSMLYRYGYVTEEEMQRLSRKKCVGNICSQYYDINGKIVDQDINERTIAAPLSDFGQKEYSIGVAGTLQKTKAILGALRGRYINVLITDAETAKALLTENEKLQPARKMTR